MKAKKLFSMGYLFYLRVKFFLTRENVQIGTNTVISPGVKIIPRNGKIIIGKNCSILDGVILDTYNGTIEIGNHVSINYYSVIYGHGGAIIGDDTRIASHVMIIPANHLYMNSKLTIRNQGESRKGISIGSDVWIGAGVTVLDSSVISNGCVIGANSLVKETTESYGVYVGNPLRKVRERI